MVTTALERTANQFAKAAITEWTEAFVKAQAGFPAVHKGQKATIPTKTGGEFTYTYASLPDLLDAILPTLEENGLAIAQSVTGDPHTISVETRIYHQAGHYETFGPLVLPSGGDARSAGSAITYARRYALCAALGIAPDEDDDGAQATRRPAPTREPEPSKPAHAVWLADQVLIFKAWTDDERKLAYAAAMKRIGLDAMSGMDDAHRIFAEMQKIYTERPVEETT